MLAALTALPSSLKQALLFLSMLSRAPMLKGVEVRLILWRKAWINEGHLMGFGHMLENMKVPNPIALIGWIGTAVGQIEYAHERMDLSPKR